MSKLLRRFAVLTLGLSLSAPSVAQAREIPTAPADYLAKKNPLAGNKDAIANGQKQFEKRCVKCHGPKGDGQGKSAADLDPPVPSFITPGYLAKRVDGQLFWIIDKGSPNTDMDTFGPGSNFNLSNDDIWGLIAYMRSKFGVK